MIRPALFLVVTMLGVSGLFAQGKPVQAKAVGFHVEIESKFLQIPHDSSLGADFSEGLVGLRAIYSREDFQKLLRNLNQRKGVDLLSAPKVSTRPGTRCNIQMVREFRYPSEIFQDADQGNIALPAAFETMPVGITLDCEPTLNKDYSITLSLSPRVVDFDGLIDFGGSREAKDDLSGNPAADTVQPSPTGSVINQPVFSRREFTTDVTMRSGETVMLGPLTMDSRQPLDAFYAKSSTEPRSKRSLYIFVTAEILNTLDGEPLPDATTEPIHPAPAPPSEGVHFYGRLVPDRDGFIRSPYASALGYVDVRGYPVHTEILDPYTKQTFLVPAPDGVTPSKSKDNGTLISRTYVLPFQLVKSVHPLAPGEQKKFWESQGIVFPPGAEAVVEPPRLQMSFINTKTEHEKLIELFVSSTANPAQ